MNSAITHPETGSDIPTNVALYAQIQSQKWHDPRCQAKQKMGLSRRRSCDLYPFALFCAWANTVKWLK